MGALIWWNDDLTIFVIDVPDSISAAQVVNGQPITHRLLSTWPYREPCDKELEYVKMKRKGRIENFSRDMQKYHEPIIPLINGALTQIKLKGEWCNSRALRKKDEDKDKDKAEDKAEVCKDGTDSEGDTANGVKSLKDRPAKLLKDLIDGQEHIQMLDTHEQSESDGAANTAGLLDADPKNIQAESSSVGDATYSYAESSTSKGPSSQSGTAKFQACFHNPFDHIVNLNLKPKLVTNENIETSTNSFRIPPHSTFLLSDCMNADLFRQSLEEMQKGYNLSKKFDLILMDPPWPNKSAKRSNKYSVFNKIDDMWSMWEGLDLRRHIAPAGFVAVWVTNNETVFDHVLGQDGLFAQWGVKLVEEWYWLKTVPDGRPVFSLDSQFRKPWETLLIGQETPDSAPVSDERVKTRVIAGVPDVHSRKPCLKRILEMVLDKKEGQYQALEIFARTCTAGWWSWGNEAFLFNWEGFWVEKAEKGKKKKKKKKKKNNNNNPVTEEQQESGAKEDETASTNNILAGNKRKASELE